MKTCYKCKLTKSFDFFSKKGNGWQSECKKCRAEYNQKHYENNKQKYVSRALKSRAQRKEKYRKRLDSFKNAPCADCHRNYPPFCMDFDHTGNIKNANVSELIESKLDTLKKEIALCDLVCANCHRIRTHNRIHSSSNGKKSA